MLQNTYFEISRDATCAPGEVIISPVISNSYCPPVKINIWDFNWKALTHEHFATQENQKAGITKLCVIV